MRPFKEEHLMVKHALILFSEVSEIFLKENLEIKFEYNIDKHYANQIEIDIFNVADDSFQYTALICYLNFEKTEKDDYIKINTIPTEEHQILHISYNRLIEFLENIKLEGIVYENK